MIADVGFLDILWSLLVLFLLVQYLIVAFVVILDVFISEDLSGARKAVWLVALLVFPLVALIVYVVSRGDGLGQRRLARQRRRQPTDDVPPDGIPPPPR